MDTRRLQTELLVQAGRLLLEYNESTGAIHRALTATAKALTDEPCHIAVACGGAAVSLTGEAPTLLPVRELRYNTAVQARVHTILRLVRRGELEPAAALAQLGRVEADAPKPARWVAILVLGAAAASLAVLLGADAGAVAVVGLASGLGLLMLPLTAALVGAILGDLAIRLGPTPWKPVPLTAADPVPRPNPQAA